VSCQHLLTYHCLPLATPGATALTQRCRLTTPVLVVPTCTCPAIRGSHSAASLWQHQVQLRRAQRLTPAPAAPPETALLVQGAPAHTALPPDSSLCW
jgi:hypothetical protein